MILAAIFPAAAAGNSPADNSNDTRSLLVMGDSMSGWMGERLNAYGQTNGFEVATIVWDGSTIRKWGDAKARIREYMEDFNPDAVVICLGLNESAEKNPGTRLESSVDNIMSAVGDRPVIWIGPPSWPGKDYGEPLNSWLAGKMGTGHYFDSLDLELPRQSASNPHPSRAGINTWTDSIVKWISENAADSGVALPGYKKPADSAASRGKIFIYRKMKESL